jgi:hypothetical protein
MFSLIKLIIWIAGIITVSYFLLPYIGYELNLNYWSERKMVCQEKLQECQKDLIKGGIEGAKENCNIQCVDPKLLIKKSKSE